MIIARWWWWWLTFCLKWPLTRVHTHPCVISYQSTNQILLFRYISWQLHCINSQGVASLTLWWPTFFWCTSMWFFLSHVTLSHLIIYLHLECVTDCFVDLSRTLSCGILKWNSINTLMNVTSELDLYLSICLLCVYHVSWLPPWSCILNWLYYCVSSLNCDSLIDVDLIMINHIRSLIWFELWLILDFFSSSLHTIAWPL